MTKAVFDTPGCRNAIGQEIGHIVEKGVRTAKMIAPYFSNTPSYINFTKIQSAKLICDLYSNSCNPHTIQELSRLRNVEIRYRNDIHAKVYLFDEQLVIGSANPTPNGLSIGTLEAAVFMSLSQTAVGQPEPKATLNADEWFDELWNEATPLGDVDWDLLIENWEKSPSRETTGIPETNPLEGQVCRSLSEVYKKKENLSDYTFSFYYQTRNGLNDDEEEEFIEANGYNRQHNHEFGVFVFEEGTFNTQADAEQCRTKIINAIENLPKKAFCIEMVSTTTPKKGKFKIDGCLIASIEKIAVRKNSANQFDVLSIYKEITDPITIDDAFVTMLSSQYSASPPNGKFKNFVNKTLPAWNHYCTPGALWAAL